MEDYSFPKVELILMISALSFYNVAFCASTITVASAATTLRVTTLKVTTLASELKLVDNTNVYIIAGIIMAGIPIAVLICCAIRSTIQHRREKKVTDDDDPNFMHPPPSHPPPRSFFRRDNTIAGPFTNPAFADDCEDGADDRSRVVTPSFISTRVVNEPSFGMPDEQRRYQYIP